MKAYVLLLAIFGAGFVLGYGLRSLLSGARRARSFARYYRRIDRRRENGSGSAPLAGDSYAG